MKKTSIAFCLLLVLAFSFGCKKDDDETSSPGLTVKMNGNSWTAQVTSAYYDPISNITLIVGANTSITEQLQLAFKGNATGTFTFEQDVNASKTYGLFAYMNTVDYYSSATDRAPVGQIVVTEYDQANQTVSGTFHFEAYNDEDVKIAFTEGSFTKIKLLQSK